MLLSDFVARRFGTVSAPVRRFISAVQVLHTPLTSSLLTKLSKARFARFGYTAIFFALGLNPLLIA
jgi:hypothetical protein